MSRRFRLPDDEKERQARELRNRFARSHKAGSPARQTAPPAPSNAGGLVKCFQCGRPIHSQSELDVGGRMLRPMHRACYAALARQHRWITGPGWPINRLSSWLKSNAVMVGVILPFAWFWALPDSSYAQLAFFLAAANGWLLLARLISYWSYERHLPRSSR